MKKLIVRNKAQIEESNEVRNEHIIISVYTPGRDPTVPVENENTKAVMSLCFHDLDSEPSPATRFAFGPVVLFDDDMAKQVVDFVEKNTVDTIVVQCDAGQSRSAGIAAAIAKYYNGNDEHFFSNRTYGIPRYTPNRLVYRKMLKTLYK